MANTNDQWPALPLAPWQDTCETLHLWTQIIGKIRMKTTPWINHSWHVPFYLTGRGMTTSLMPHEAGGIEIEFDFVDHRVLFSTIKGERRSFALRPMSVADFYEKTMRYLRELDHPVKIWTQPVELPDPVLHFSDDLTHASYDAGAVARFWRVLLEIQRVFLHFRARYIGKVSPVHFFWGAFDLAVTRFSGRAAPKHQGGVPNCADWVMEEAYSHEVSSAGFWPGAGLGEAAFYAYAYPQPEGFENWSVHPESAYYHEDLGEFVLPYEAVRTARDPDQALLTFLQSTYDAAAELADWDRENLEK